MQTKQIKLKIEDTLGMLTIKNSDTGTSARHSHWWHVEPLVNFRVVTQERVSASPRLTTSQHVDLAVVRTHTCLTATCKCETS